MLNILLGAVEDYEHFDVFTFNIELNNKLVINSM